ncbi:hypothetical protein L5I01_07830 [Gordonia sp. HY442]|uniref:hypothetical protein n=1 Tax=Gordonia zhenghanii TaxID=2911516 RepID=UPI001F2386D3|nr:hypothetical protein [Gordonia zhenghanii]MCF8603268.1 hypothetical protein [Gordonia zhenghanii]
MIWTEVTAPSGYSVRSRARNQWLLPDLGLVPCRHGEPVTRGTVETSAQPERSRTRTQVKHAYRVRIRSQCRYEQACAAAAHHTEFLEDGPPPF